MDAKERESVYVILESLRIGLSASLTTMIPGRGRNYVQGKVRKNLAELKGTIRACDDGDMEEMELEQLLPLIIKVSSLVMRASLGSQTAKQKVAAYKVQHWALDLLPRLEEIQNP